VSEETGDAYVTLRRPGQRFDGPPPSRDYHDRDSLPFDARYPLIEFKDQSIIIGDTEPTLHTQLLRNYWYQRANSLERAAMLERLVHLNENLGIVVDFIDRSYGTLGFTVEHISLAGSYLHADHPGDIDFDVVLSGSYFDYVTFNDGIELLDLTGSVTKISLTVMGMENILGNAFTHDDITNDGFTHHDTIIREILVAPMRNVTVFGKVFDEQRSVDSRNVLVRIARQLYFAELTLEGRIRYYENEPLRTRKAVNRIREAYQIIDWLIHTADGLTSGAVRDDRPRAPDGRE
jgi:hypothetical protein